MEERVLTKKQYRTFKFIRGWLMALFVLSIIGCAGLLISYISLFALAAIDVTQNPQITVSFFALIPIVVASIMLGTLLFHKGPNRKNDVSGTMLFYAACSVALGIFNLAASTLSVTSSSTVISIANTLFVVYSVIFLFFAILLFRKTRQMHMRTFPNQMLFILYIIILFVSQYMAATQLYPSGMARDTGIEIAINIVAGFAAFMYLLPMISLYKALDDEVFYEHFIVSHPSVAINRYERTAFRPAAKPQAAGYCVNCGAPLLPGAVYCSVCGHKVGERIIKKEN